MRVTDEEAQEWANTKPAAHIPTDLARDLLDARRECAELLKALRMMTDLATHQGNVASNLRHALERVVKSGAGTFRDIARAALADSPFKASP